MAEQVQVVVEAVIEPAPLNPASIPPTMLDSRLRVTLAAIPEGDPSRRYVVGESTAPDVSRAADRDLRRPVALKIGDGDAFLREARLTAQLEHPNIVPVHDVGRTADGKLFFAMKVVAGKTFAEALAEPGSPAERLDVLMKACDAVAFAHARGVAHRGLVSSKIRVGDFGDVTVTDWSRAEKGADPREDVRALEGILSEILKAERSPPRELSAMTAATYATAKEFQDDLRRYIEGRELKARRDPLPVRAIKWVRRNPIPSAAAAAAVVALTLGVLTTKWVAASKAAAEQARVRREAEARSAELEREAEALSPATSIEALLAAEEKLREAQKLLRPYGGRPAKRYEVNRRLGDAALRLRDWALARMAFSVCTSIDARREDLDKIVADAEQSERRDREKKIRAALEDMTAGLSRPSRGEAPPFLDDYVFEVAGYRDEQTVRLIAEALEPLREKAKKDGKAAVWSQPEQDVLHFSFDVLGRLGLESAVTPLAGMMGVLWDHTHVVECGLALCNTRSPAANDPLAAARDRLGINSEEWRQIERRFGRVPESAGAPEPRTADGFNSRGLTRRAKGDVVGAIADFDKAIALDPSHQNAFCNRGVARASLNELAGAIEDFSKAIKLDPAYAAAHSNRGNVRQRHGDLAGAIEDYSKAIDLGSRDAITFSNRGDARRDNRDFEGAIEDCTKAIELDPKMAMAFSNRGLARLAKGDVSGAIEDCTKAIALDPRDAAAYNNRANARHESGDHAGAIEDYSKAIAIDPKNAQPFHNRGTVHRDRGILFEDAGRREDAQAEWAAAISDFSKAIEIDPKCAAAYQCRGLVHFIRDDLQASVADWEKFVELAPNDPKAATLRKVIQGAREKLKKRDDY